MVPIRLRQGTCAAGHCRPVRAAVFVGPATGSRLPEERDLHLYWALTSWLLYQGQMLTDLASCRWNYFYSCAISVPVEISAAVVLLTFWDADVSRFIACFLAAMLTPSHKDRSRCGVHRSHYHLRVRYQYFRCEMVR